MLQFSEWLDEFEYEYLEELLVELKEPEIPSKIAALADMDLDKLNPSSLQLLAKWFGISHLNPTIWKDAIKRLRQNRMAGGLTRDPSQQDVVGKIQNLMMRRGKKGPKWVKPHGRPSWAGDTNYGTAIQ
jgi:hypothetical protein